MSTGIARGRWEAQEIIELPKRTPGRNWAIAIGLLAAAGIGAYVLWPRDTPAPAPVAPEEAPTATP